MPLVRFTQNIQRHVKCPQQQVAGGCVRDVLNAYFKTNGSARGYVLDDDGSLRHHMAIFIDGKPVTDRQSLSDRVPHDGTVDVMQALSGG